MIIDVNVSLGRWPFQEFSIKNANALATHLKKKGITRGVVRSCQTPFLTDPSTDNQNLVEELKNFPELTPVPTVNPRLREWRKTLKPVDYPGICVYPSYHGYRLDSIEMNSLAVELIKAGTALFIPLRLEDVRTMHPQCIIPDILPHEINAFAVKFPELKLICLNAGYGEPEILAENAVNIFTDIAFYENGDSLANLTKKVSPSQILFGSHTPFFHTESALMKLAYGTVSESIRQSIAFKNAISLFKHKGIFQ